MLRSAARPGKKPEYQQEGYRFPYHDGQVFTGHPPKIQQAIDITISFCRNAGLNSEFSAMLMMQTRPPENNHA
jgi:hypothetical protein